MCSARCCRLEVTTGCLKHEAKWTEKCHIGGEWEVGGSWRSSSPLLSSLLSSPLPSSPLLLFSPLLSSLLSFPLLCSPLPSSLLLPYFLPSAFEVTRTLFRFLAAAAVANLLWPSPMPSRAESSRTERRDFPVETLGIALKKKRGQGEPEMQTWSAESESGVLFVSAKGLQ